MVLLSFQQPPSHSGQGTAGNAVLGPTARGSPSFPSLRARDWATSHQPRQGPRCSQEPPHLGQPDPRVFQLPCPEPLPVGTGYSFLPQRLPVRQGHGSHSTPQQHRALTMAQLPDLAHRVQALTTPPPRMSQTLPGTGAWQAGREPHPVSRTKPQPGPDIATVPTPCSAPCPDSLVQGFTV